MVLCETYLKRKDELTKAERKEILEYARGRCVYLYFCVCVFVCACVRAYVHACVHVYACDVVMRGRIKETRLCVK